MNTDTTSATPAAPTAGAVGEPTDAAQILAELIEAVDEQDHWRMSHPAVRSLLSLDDAQRIGVRVDDAWAAARAAAATPPPQAEPPEPEAAQQYRRDNPNGGPANTFDAVADAIRAGDPVERAMALFGLAWKSQLPQAAQPEPDGKLHADGYFTWRRRDGYVLDRLLPCDFYLSAPPADGAVTELAAAARGVVERWDSPNWKIQASTADSVNRLRAALAGLDQKGEAK